VGVGPEFVVTGVCSVGRCFQHAYEFSIRVFNKKFSLKGKRLRVRRSSSLYAWVVLDQLQIKCMSALTTMVRWLKKSRSTWRSTEVADKVGGTNPREVLIRQNLSQERQTNSTVEQNHLIVGVIVRGEAKDRGKRH